MTRNTDREPPRHRALRWGRLATIVTVVGVLAVTLVVLVIIRSHQSTSGAGSTPPGTTSHGTTPTQPAAPTSSASAGPSTTVTPSRTSIPAQPLAGYVPLYPFTALSDVRAWEDSYRSGGHQPWHLNAGQTALSFTRGYLGLRDVDRVGTARTSSDGAHVDVSYRDPAGRLHTAATLHLMRFGTDADAPWEVVGSDDSTFTLDVPAYSSTVRSPCHVGGVITGTDESISITAYQLNQQAALGSSPGVPAGGVKQPWSSTVSFNGAKPGALTIVATTGGHLLAVERFAITGVYVN